MIDIGSKGWLLLWDYYSHFRSCCDSFRIPWLPSLRSACRSLYLGFALHKLGSVDILCEFAAVGIDLWLKWSLLFQLLLLLLLLLPFKSGRIQLLSAAFSGSPVPFIGLWWFLILFR